MFLEAPKVLGTLSTYQTNFRYFGVIQGKNQRALIYLLLVTKFSKKSSEVAQKNCTKYKLQRGKQNFGKNFAA